LILFQCLRYVFIINKNFCFKVQVKNLLLYLLVSILFEFITSFWVLCQWPVDWVSSVCIQITFSAANICVSKVFAPYTRVFGNISQILSLKISMISRIYIFQLNVTDCNIFIYLQLLALFHPTTLHFHIYFYKTTTSK